MENFMRVLKKSAGQTQKEFITEAGQAYAKLMSEFVLKGEDNFYQTMLNATKQMDEDAEATFTTKLDMFSGCAMRKVLQIAGEKTEVLVPDDRYLTDLYNEYKKSDKSLDAMSQIINEFLDMLDEMYRQIDSAYDKAFSISADKSIKIEKKDSSYTQEQFTSVIWVENGEFTFQFLSENGIYFDLFYMITDWSINAGRSASKKYDSIINTFLTKTVNQLRDLSKRKTEIPMLNGAYFRALYYKSLQAQKSPLAINRISDDFASAIEEYSRKINSLC